MLLHLISLSLRHAGIAGDCGMRGCRYISKLAVILGCARAFTVVVAIRACAKVQQDRVDYTLL